jgi:hypothetical protein
MMRYRYGPWDPSYFAVLGSLVGRGLIEAIPAEGTNLDHSSDLGRDDPESIIRGGETSTAL